MNKKDIKRIEYNFESTTQVLIYILFIYIIFLENKKIEKNRKISNFLIVLK